MMDADNFHRKSVKELQKYLKDMDVSFLDSRRIELFDLCKATERLGIEVDPDGLLEDRDDILREKMTAHDNDLSANPETVTRSKDLSILPPLTIFDIYIIY